MADSLYLGRPIQTTLYQIKTGKISNGESVRVTVTTDANTTLQSGQFLAAGGILGFCMTNVAANTTADVILEVMEYEYETNQIDTSKTFGTSDKIYWDAAAQRFTTDATAGPYAGFVTNPKDTNNFIWFKFQPPVSPRKLAAQADSTAADVATLKADFNALLAKLRAANMM